MIRSVPLCELRTPWPSQPVVWRASEDYERTANLRQDVAEGRDYIVREVLVNHPKFKMNFNVGLSNLSRRKTKTVLRMADREFRAFTDAGFVCPPVEWHVFTDKEDRVRTLARVAVIEGVGLPIGKYYSQMNEAERAELGRFEDMYSDYLASPEGGKYFMYDTESPAQYLEGQLRNPVLCAQLTPEVSTCLADIEPASWKLRDKAA